MRKNIAELRREAEEYFRRVEQDLNAANEAYRHILRMLDTSLATGNYTELLKLISYMEEAEGHVALQYIGKSHRLLRILNIIKLELLNGSRPFCHECGSEKALWEKYMLTLFAFRRLIFRLSEESISEAVVYLQRNPLSPLAAFIMTQGELLIPGQDFYETLEDLYWEIWSPGEMQQFQALRNPSASVPEHNK